MSLKSHEPIARKARRAGEPLELYLREVESHALLTPEEEKEHLQRLMDTRDAWLTAFLHTEGALESVWSDFLDWRRKRISGTALIPGPPKLKPGQVGPEHHMARLFRVFERHAKAHGDRPFRYALRRKTRRLVRALLFIGLRPKPLTRYREAAIAKHGDRLAKRIDAARQEFIDARQPLIERNLRLVLKVAWGYVPGPMTFDELIQEGNVGLMRATESFNGRFAVRFSTYAYLWIRQSVIRALEEKSRMIRLPVHLTHLLRKVMREHDGEKELPEVVHYQGKKYRVPQLLANPTVTGGIVSIDQTRDEENGLAEVIRDVRAVMPDESAHLGDLGNLVNRSLRGLGGRHRKILAMRFGIGHRRTHTLAEIGEVLGVSSERVRQLQEEAFQELRNGPHAEILAELAD
ncbi:MAG: sigma-70 family RNA polymerase sigma factor [Planctomycetes bacterium]|nr:sigma-70 family RNA polymerase sigma factor [Planctomycetota bacterium]